MESEKNLGLGSSRGGVRKALYVSASSWRGSPTPDQLDKLDLILRTQGETPLWQWMLNKKRPSKFLDAIDLLIQCVELGWTEVLEAFLSEQVLRQSLRLENEDLILKSRGVFDADKKAVSATASALLRWLPQFQPRLKTLWIERLPISCKDLCEVLKLTPSLSDLRVIDVGFGDSQAKDLAKGLAASVQLRRLTLRGCKFESTDAAEALVEAILKHPAIEDIELSDCGFTKASSSALKRLLGSPRLFSIDLSRNAFASSGAKFLAGLKGNASLQRLVLKACGLDEVAEALFLDVLPKAKITHLDLERNKLCPTFVSASSTLVWLSIAKSTATDLASGIEDIEKSKSLKYLSLAGIDLDSSRPGPQRSLNAVIRLIGSGSPLSHLVLRGCAIHQTAELQRLLRASMFNGALQSIDLADNFSLITAQVDFDDLARNKTLIELDLGSNYFAPPAQDKLWAALAQSSTLKVLKLANTRIDFRSDAFASWIRANTSIHTLDVSGFQFDFDNLEPLLNGVADSPVIESLSADVLGRGEDQQKAAMLLRSALHINRKLIHVQTNLSSHPKLHRSFMYSLEANFRASMMSLESCRSLVARLLAEWQHAGDVATLPDEMCAVISDYLAGPPGQDTDGRQRERLRLALKLRLINRRLSGLSPFPALAIWPDLPLPELPHNDDSSESSD